MLKNSSFGVSFFYDDNVIGPIVNEIQQFKILYTFTLYFVAYF